ncbi:Hsp70 family protein [candidate division KSB1 bacterium]|nr:Hsp70 family protein [candidate division KSB1 bacterium]
MSPNGIDNSHHPVIGIDLGTTYSCIARWDGRAPEVYHVGTGDLTLPSVVYYDERNDDFLVGQIAVKKGRIDPDNAVFGVKRKMDNKNEQIVLGKKTFNPIDISRMILEKLVQDVRNKYPKGVFHEEGAVVTVPYYFKAHQCRNTEEAAENANLILLGILQEPIAAAMAYMWQLDKDNKLSDRSEKFLVFDLGGGTFDVTIFELFVNEEKIQFNVLATGGDDRLGGLDFDKAVMDHLIESENLKDYFKVPDNLSPADRLKKEKEIRRANQNLMENAKIAKEALSAMPLTYVAIPQVFPGKDIDTELSREKLNELLQIWVDKVGDIIESTVASAHIGKEDVDIAIKVGGSSQLTCMADLLIEKFGEKKVYGDINPSLCVAQGAAIYAAIQDGRLNIDKDVEINARTSHALGVEVDDGDFHVIIPANKEAPCKGSGIFGTDTDYVTELDVVVYQGASKKVKDNSKVGAVHVSGLLPKPAGELDIKITFMVSDQNIVSIIVEQKESKLYKVEKMQVA